MQFHDFAYMHSDCGLGRRIQRRGARWRKLIKDVSLSLSLSLPSPRLFEVGGRFIIGVWTWRMRGGGCLVFVGDGF